jgi:hypothetical protein
MQLSKNSRGTGWAILEEIADEELVLVEVGGIAWPGCGGRLLYIVVGRRGTALLLFVLEFVLVLELVLVFGAGGL